MGNRFNIPVPPDVSDGGTQEAKSATGWKWWSKRLGRSDRKIRRINPEALWDVESSDKAD